MAHKHKMLLSAGALNKARAFVSANAEPLSVWSRTRPGSHTIDISYLLGGSKRVLVMPVTQWNALLGTNRAR